VRLIIVVTPPPGLGATKSGRPAEGDCPCRFTAYAESLIIGSISHNRLLYELRDLILGLLVHMVVVGLPISFSVRRFPK